MSVDSAKELILAFSERRIAFCPMFARISGSATTGLFLSQLFYWTGLGTDPHGWIWKTGEEWEAETCLTRAERERARDTLKKIGLLEEKLCGLPATVHYRLNLDLLYDLVVQDYQNEQRKKLEKEQACAEQTSWEDSDKPVCSPAANCLAETRQTITETTAQTTTKTLISPQPPSTKRKRSPEAQAHDAAVSSVVDYFSGLTGLPIRKGEIFARWRNPARELLEMFDWDVEKTNQHVLRTYQKMKQDGLTYNSIESIMKVATYLMSAERPVRTGAREWG
jgi:hypothetical protein